MDALAIYPGSFDPPTFGHMDLVERAAKLFPRLIVAVGVHPTREPLFTPAERAEFLRGLCKPYPNVTVDCFDGLLINYARSVSGRVIVRGLRAQTDFEYELQIAHANADMAPELDSVFLPTRTRHGFVSASLVREIAKHEGDVSRYAPEPVLKALEAKFLGKAPGS